jgi:hypothetical protein
LGTIGLDHEVDRQAVGGPRLGRPLLKLSSRANTDYPLTLSKTCSVTLDSSRDCR